MKKLLALAIALMMILSIDSSLADDKVTVTFWYSLSGANAECIKENLSRFIDFGDGPHQNSAMHSGRNWC